jgi:hypothetical protein
VRERALSLHRDIAKFLAAIRSRPDMSETEFWDTFKGIEHEIAKLRFGRFE